MKLYLKEAKSVIVNREGLICSKNSFAYVCNEIECDIAVTQLPGRKPILSSGFSCMLYIHHAAHKVCIKRVIGINLCEIILNLIAEYTNVGHNPKSVRYLKSESEGKVVIATTSNIPICCEKFEVLPNLGRFTLRDEGRFIIIFI